ncbi:MAG TPA: methyltransferase domain-containing protein [Candidatus Woesearchaeota archaeon]|nr:methyltransferase domain-containing protein [Candidatus Woesearchaeota archaeon]
MIPAKKELEIMLSAVQGFTAPKPELEQYMTPSSIAAQLLWVAHMNKHIQDKRVADLGCGTGILSIGAALLGARTVHAYDIDKQPLEIAKNNEEIIKKSIVPSGRIVWTQKDINSINEKVDTVIMNPPFGIQTKHMDRIFLEKAFELADNVYSVHSAGSAKFLQKFSEEHGFNAVLFSINQLVLKHTMSFHQKEKYPIMVELWRFWK